VRPSLRSGIHVQTTLNFGMPTETRADDLEASAVRARHVGPDAPPLRLVTVAGRVGLSGFAPPVMPPRTAPHLAAHAV
jgi:hypothetical protein